MTTLLVVQTPDQHTLGLLDMLDMLNMLDMLVWEASAKGQSPPQELEESQRSGLYLLVLVILESSNKISLHLPSLHHHFFFLYVCLFIYVLRPRLSFYPPNSPNLP